MKENRKHQSIKKLLKNDRKIWPKKNKQNITFVFPLIISIISFFFVFLQKKFIEKHKANIKKYGMFRHYDDSQKFLEDHLELVCEETANYLVVWCIDLEMEEVIRFLSLIYMRIFFRNIVLWNMLVIKQWSCNLFLNWVKVWKSIHVNVYDHFLQGWIDFLLEITNEMFI